ncbi:MAG TPA: HEAT repeat domain-containing protein [Allosphingosinicella sp.]|nr:HEAT repeat domain-containing protein [Allosphingosinicella sp.]
MIKSQELREWLGNPESQRRTHAAMDSFAARWGKGLIHRRFASAMEALPAQSAEAVAGAVSELFSDDAWLDTLTEELAEQLRRDRYFEPPFRSLHSEIHSGLLVYEDERVAIAAGVTGVGQLAAKKNVARHAVSISFTGHVSVLKVVKSGGAYMSFWEAPPITDGFVAAQAGHCVGKGGRHLVDGEVLIVDGRFQSYVIEHASSDMILLQASVKLDQAPLSVEYDAGTRRFVGASATDDAASRIQNMTTLLRKMDCADAFPVVAAFLEDSNFFVRWHVMKELLGIDAAAALPHLRRLAQADPHPDVRAAASAVLDSVLLTHPVLAERLECRG